MLMDRIVKAFTFKTEVYDEVKTDKSFTPSAWGIVIVVNILNQLAGYLAAGAVAAAAVTAVGGLDELGLGGLGGFGAAASGSLIGAVVGMAFSIAGFAFNAWLVGFIANQLFKAKSSFEELVRTMGLASVWGLVGVLSILAVITPLLLCLTGLVGFAAGILSLVAYAFAVKAAVGLDWTQTIITVVIAWVVTALVVGLITGIVVGAVVVGAAL